MVEKVPVKAFIRIRPGSGGLVYDDRSVSIVKGCGEVVAYEFDGVFGPECTQAQVFDTLRPIVARLVDGQNQSVFCYGNTGSGKTYTMVGTEDSPGLMYNLVEEILRHGEVVVSYMEIYNEKIYDLLEPKELTLREFNKAIVVPNLSARRARNMDEFREVFSQGTGNRTTGETRLNKSSSRSHGILRICMGEHKLHLIDLAGSENNRKTGNEGVRLAESSNINRSLFVVGKVVNAILRRESRIPYRDSKLTRLLQDSLGGSSLCYIIANVSDDGVGLGESINTLSFASKSRNILNGGGRLSSECSKRMEGGKWRDGEKREPLSVRTNMRFNLCRRDVGVDGTKGSASKGGGGSRHRNSVSRKESSSPSILKAFLEKPDVMLSPHTKEKSYRAFLRRAQEFESAQKYRLALEDYKTIQKFCDSDFIKQKIEAMNKLFKRPRKKQVLTSDDVLNILNNGDFFDIKKVPRIGDKRAQAIVGFIDGGNLFESLSDLRLLFSKKVVESILNCVSDKHG